MSEAGYKIEVDAPRNHLRLTCSGFMDFDMLASLQRELDAAFTQLATAGGQPGSHLTLIDLRDQGVQSLEIATRLQAIAARFTPLSRRVALLMPDSVLYKLQIKRGVSGDTHLYFHDEQEALRWLFGGNETVAGTG